MKLIDIYESEKPKYGKFERAKALFNQLKKDGTHLDEEAVIKRFMDECKVSRLGAETYYWNLTRGKKPK